MALPKSPLARTLVAVAAGVGLTIATIQVWTVTAAPGDTDTTFVPVAPCRLFDTRPAPNNVGARNTPLSGGQPHSQQVTGNQGNCTGASAVPTGAIGVALNVTAIAPTAQSNLRLYPANLATPPVVSNLNFSADQKPVANKVDVKLSPDGKVNVLNFNGNVHVAADVVGYYINTTLKQLAAQTGTPGPAGAPGPTGPIGPTGKTGPGGPSQGRLIKRLRTVAEPSNVGLFSSIAIDALGHPVISHANGATNDLLVTACTNPTCSGAGGVVTTTVDGAGNVGYYSSIAIGSNGNPIISYYDSDNGNLKIAACDDPACVSATMTSPLTLTENDGWYSSIAIGTNGNPVISHWDGTNTDLDLTICTDPLCTASSTTTVDSGGVGVAVGEYSSITITPAGNPIISYWDSENANLKVAACNNPTCTTSTITTLDSAGLVGQFTSITIGTNGNPVISYFDSTNGDLKVAACSNAKCTAATYSTVDTAGGFWTSITIGTNGNPIISYAITDDLKVAYCNNPACTTATLTNVDGADTADTVGYFSSIALGASGNPIISYYNSTGGDLKVAVLSFASWTPNAWDS